MCARMKAKKKGTIALLSEGKILSDKLNLYAQATRLSLKNAEQWIKDAKLLIETSSFGHASALLRFACEEVAKAYVCWFTSEKIWPVENKVVRDVFWDHMVKNEVILGLLFTVMWMSRYNIHKEVTEGRLEPSDEEITLCLRWNRFLHSIGFFLSDLQRYFLLILSEHTHKRMLWIYPVKLSPPYSSGNLNYLVFLQFRKVLVESLLAHP